VKAIRILSACMIMFAIAVFAIPLFAVVVDKIVVVVNGEAITEREIERILDPIYEQYRGLYYGDELIKKLEEVRRKVIDQLVDDRLILSEAKKLDVQIPEKDIDTRVNEVSRRFPNQQAMEAALTQQGLSLKELRKNYKEQMMVRRLIDGKIGATISISPVELKEYFEKHSNEFVTPEQVKLLNILVRPKECLPNDKADELIRDIQKKLKDGADFGELAKQYSEGPNAAEGGDMGHVKKGDILPDIEKVIFELKPGEVSDIIKTNMGYHIFKVIERSDRQCRDFSSVRHEIEETIYREKIKDKIRAWVFNLKKNAYIEFK
jgi:peptidyl-prolyl cis-trans isomerase SurA